MKRDLGQSQELFTQIVKGRSPDIRQFLIDGMSDLLNRAFVAERSVYLSSNGNNRASHKNCVNYSDPQNLDQNISFS